MSARPLTQRRVQRLVESLRHGRNCAQQEKEPSAQHAFLLGYVKAELADLVDDLAGSEAADEVRAALVLS